MRRSGRRTRWMSARSLSPGRQQPTRSSSGLADQEFWDGGGTVRLITWLHVAVVGGFLAIALGVTVRALASGSPHAGALGWGGIALGAATIALAVAYVVLDALDTPAMSAPERRSHHGHVRREAPRRWWCTCWSRRLPG